MASNNYAEVITDSTEAQQILAEFEGKAARNCSFKALEFDPGVGGAGLFSGIPGGTEDLVSNSLNLQH